MPLADVAVLGTAVMVFVGIVSYSEGAKAERERWPMDCGKDVPIQVNSANGDVLCITAQLPHASVTRTRANKRK